MPDIDDMERLRNAGVPCELFCPSCDLQHLDEGEWATRPHRTHQCQFCSHLWRPFDVATYGVLSRKETQRKINQIALDRILHLLDQIEDNK